MNSGDGYLGMYNETEMNVDNLNLNNLTASNGTIIILNTTTGTITTLNTTTANITTLLTDLWRGTTTGSSMVIGVNGDTGTLTSWRSLIMEANKTITMNATGGVISCNSFQGATVASNVSLFTNSTGSIFLGNDSNTNSIQVRQTLLFNASKNIILQPTGQLYVETIRGNEFANPINMYLLQLGAINFGNTASTNPLTISNNTILASGKTLTLNATGGKILCNVYTGTATSSNLTIGESGNTGNLSIYKTINTNLILGTGNTILLTSTGSISTNTIRGVLFADTISLYLSQTGAISLGNNLGTGGGITFNDNITLPANRTISLNATGGEISCNTYKGTAAGSTITLFGASTGTFNIGNTSNANALVSNQTLQMATGKDIILTPTGYLQVETIRGYTGTDPVSIYLSQTGAISFGNNLGTGGGITFNDNITLPANRRITLNSTGGKILCNEYQALATTDDPLIFTELLAGSIITIGSTTSTLLLNSNTFLDMGSTLFTNAISSRLLGTLTLTGEATIGISLASLTSMSTNLLTFRASNIAGVNTADNISLFPTTTGTMSLGNTGGGNLTINPSVVLASGKNLTLSTTGKVVVDTIEGTAATDAISLFPTTTSTITCGLAAGAGFSILCDVSIGTNSVNKGIACNYLSTFNSGNLLQIAPILEAGNIRIGERQTTGNVQIGHSTAGSDSGTLTINKNVAMPTNKNITLNTNGVISCGFFNALSASGSLSIGQTSTTGTISIGGFQTSGTVNLSNTTATAGVRLRNKFQQNTATGNSFWNVAVGSANNIFQGAGLATSAMAPVYVNAALDDWCVWESDAELEPSFIAQNGNTMIICNPGDNSAFHWVDEDFLSFATGFKFSEVGVMTVSSDSRLKRDIKPLNKNNLLSKLNKIDIINYSKKRPQGITRPGADEKYARVHTGYTAQQLIEIGLDEFVQQPVTPDGYMSVCYGDVQFLFNAGVQELIKQNKEQQRQIDDLTTRLAKLEQIILTLP